MSGVDVLAVMDRAALAIRSDFATRTNPDPDAPLREARAAVAELVEAAKQAQTALSHNWFCGDRNNDDVIDADERLSAALAKFTPEAP